MVLVTYKIWLCNDLIPCIEFPAKIRVRTSALLGQQAIRHIQTWCGDFLNEKHNYF